jgi:DNA polymerase-3 subunit epsilon
MVPRTLGATYEYYCHKEYKRKYTTPTDAEAAAEILYHQFTRYSEIRNREFLCKLQKAQFENEEAGIRNFYWRDGQAHFAFSKHIDKSVAEVAGEDPGFLRWMLKAHFAPETKEIVKLALSEHAYVSRQPDNSEKDE